MGRMCSSIESSQASAVLAVADADATRIYSKWGPHDISNVTLIAGSDWILEEQ